MVRPAFDPWLAHLRRDRRGLPVPYVNQWGQQATETTHVRYDPHVRMPAFFVDDVGEVPDFTRQNMQRERECMAAGLCQVCRRPVPWSRRNLVLSAVSTEAVQLPGLGPVGAVNEAWLDDRCAAIATAWCPALIRRAREDDLAVVKVTRRNVQLITSVGWCEGALETETRGDPPAMWVKAALPGLAVPPEART